jgi:hypothetical protein
MLLGTVIFSKMANCGNKNNHCLKHNNRPSWQPVCSTKSTSVTEVGSRKDKSSTWMVKILKLFSYSNTRADYSNKISITKVWLCVIICNSSSWLLVANNFWNVYLHFATLYNKCSTNKMKTQKGKWKKKCHLFHLLVFYKKNTQRKYLEKTSKLVNNIKFWQKNQTWTTKRMKRIRYSKAKSIKRKLQKKQWQNQNLQNIEF